MRRRQFAAKLQGRDGARWPWLCIAAALGSCGWLAGVGATLPPEHDVRTTISAILAKREFTPPPPNPLDRLTQAVLEDVGKLVGWLLRPINWLVERLTDLAGTRSPLALWMVVALLVGLLLLVMFHIYSMSVGAFRTGRRKSLRRPAAVPMQAQNLLEKARAAAAAGDFRDAVRLTYQAVLVKLDQAGIIRYDPSHTNWEYAHEVASREPLGHIFAQLTSIADRAMYSDTPVTYEHYARSNDFWIQTEELLR